METGARYAKLLELAQEKSSEKRRELLNDVTDLFFATTDNRSPVESVMFGELMTKVAYELDVEVRKNLSVRMSHGLAPRRLALALASDTEIAVASPMLRHSLALTQDDLISVVKQRSDEHRLMVTTRPDVSEALSAALVSYGNDKVVAALIRNDSAKVSNSTYDQILDRAAVNPYLNDPLVSRKSIPPEYLNKLYASVDSDLRAKILERNAHYSEAEIQAALDRAKTQVAIDCGALPQDYDAATQIVENQKKSNTLSATALPSLWRDKKITQFTVSFGSLVGLDYHQAQNLFELKDIDTIAMVCRAAGLERALFVTIAVLVLGESGMGQAKVLGDMYNNVPEEAAQRGVRFLKLRSSTFAKAA
jgi:uncharacterized protein (DUF2336 family)